METEVTLIDEARSATGLPRTGFHLLVMSPEAFLTVPLPDAGELTIGRASDANIRIEDRMASRRHAVLAVVDGGFFVEDGGSANGTRVRDEALAPNQRVRIDAGEAIVIGGTVLMVQPNRASIGTRRLWSHSAFEGRLEDECARAAGSNGQFAIARFRLDRGAEWARALPVLARELPVPHGLAAYGPNDYEVLFVEAGPAEIERLVGQTTAGLRGAGIDVRAALAFFPRDGRSAQALLGHANGLLRPARSEANGVDLVNAAVLDPRMDRVRQLATRAAASNINVLILGETGVGKEVLARGIHRQSARSAAPFLALNCAGLTETLIESELFGYEKGAFTGAGHSKLGLLESANGGTVFLDEIGEMPQGLQARLLRVIESREVLPVGALKPRSIDVRFVAATNRDLEADVLRGTFRRDLFFRLNGLSLTIPPLRERIVEIAELAQVFLEAAARESGRPVPLLNLAALELLQAYRWPGNIRELKNVIERAVVLCDGTTIELSHLPVDKMRPSASVVVPSPESPPDLYTTATMELPGTRPSLSPDEERERARIMQALRAAAGNQTAAAKALGMPRRTFVARLERYGVPRPRKK